MKNFPLITKFLFLARIPHHTFANITLQKVMLPFVFPVSGSAQLLHTYSRIVAGKYSFSIASYESINIS